MVERFPKSLLEFQSLFSSDEICTEYLGERRWPNGFVCPKCYGTSVWRLNSRPLWECRGCGRQTSITAGTLMAKTKLPLRVWFWAAYLMSTHSNGLSALQLKGQLGVDYNAHLLETILREIAPALGWHRDHGEPRCDRSGGHPLPPASRSA